MSGKGMVNAVLITLVVLLAGGAEAGAQMAGPPPPPPPPGPNMFYIRTFSFHDNKVVSGEPYSAQATTQTTQVLSDGNRIVRKETAKVYRDSMGRTRREMAVNAVGPWSPGTPAQMVSIFDPVAGTQYVLNAQQKKAYQMPQPPRPPSPPAGAMVSKRVLIAGSGAVEASGPGLAFVEKDAGLGHRTEVSLGTQEVAGVVAEGKKITETIPAGKIGNEKPIVITTERWYSPDLQLDVLVRHSDPRTGEVVYRLSDINRAEPDPSLFQVPPDYTVEKGPMVIKEQLH